MSGGHTSVIKWQEIPTNAPFTCAWCHCGDHGVRESFLDTGLTYDYEGTVYLCNECAKGMRQAAGWLTAEEFDEQTKGLQNTIKSLEAELADYEIIKGFLKDYGLDPVGLKRLRLAPDTAKEELRGRLNPNSIATSSNPAEQLFNGVGQQTDGAEPSSGGAVNAFAADSLFTL